MISLADLYSVLCAVVPLYVTMFLAYVSVKHWKIFTPQQCAGINRFVATFAVPLLSFEFISHINPYKMDLLFIAADFLSKLLVLVGLSIWASTSGGSVDWLITLFSLATLPNTLVMGIPLLKAMYGDDKEGLMIQAVVLQCIIWYTILLFLFEYRAARLLVVSKLKNASAELLEKASTEEEVADHMGMITTSTSSDVSETDKVQNCHKLIDAPALRRPNDHDGNELHLFIWPCGCCTSAGVSKQSVQVCTKKDERDSGKSEGKEAEMKPEEAAAFISSSEMMTSILKMVCYKLVRNPNSYASILGLAWALVSWRWGIKKPQILENSVTILSNAGLGMAMFSLGLFMALQPKIIACGTRLAVYGMLARFAAGPAVMGIASMAVRLRGTVLRVAIVQAALPQGIVPFVFAREYDLHADVLSTAVIFGMIVSLPITILYYILLGL